MSFNDLLIKRCPECSNEHTVTGLSVTINRCPGARTPAHQHGCCHYGEQFVVDGIAGKELVNSPCTDRC
jgi:hypothetical protein